MTRREAIPYLEAILKDTLERDDERDAKRIEAVELAIAVLQIDRRPRRRFPEGAVKVGGSREAYSHVRYLGRQAREHLVGLYLDAQNCLILRETLSMGTLMTCLTLQCQIHSQCNSLDSAGTAPSEPAAQSIGLGVIASGAGGL